MDVVFAREMPLPEEEKTTFYFNDSQIEVPQTYIGDAEKRDKGGAKWGKKIMDGGCADAWQRLHHGTLSTEADG